MKICVCFPRSGFTYQKSLQVYRSVAPVKINRHLMLTRPICYCSYPERILKIIVKVVEEAHNYFTKIATWILHFIFMGVFVEVRVRYTSSKIALFTALISNWHSKCIIHWFGIFSDVEISQDVFQNRLSRWASSLLQSILSQKLLKKHIIISLRSRHGFYILFLWVSSSRSAFAIPVRARFCLCIANADLDEDTHKNKM
jgi:hypothetical protein